MNRFRTYTQLDDASDVTGDVEFTALDMRSDPATLPPGVVAVSEGFRFDSQGAQVREGILRMLKPGDTLEDILLCAIYRPDGGRDQHAMIGRTRMVLFDPSDYSLTGYDYPSGHTIEPGDPVDFVQGGLAGGTTRAAYILRGLSKTVLKFNGTGISSDGSFQAGEFGLFYQDRMVVNSAKQSVSISDFLDFATWQLLNQFKVLHGSDDELVGFLPYQKDYVVIGSRKRFFLAYFAPGYNATGYSGSLRPIETWLRDLTREAGPVGQRAMMEAAGLIWFISDNGIYAFQPRLDLELTVLGEPVSAPISPVLKRLNANAAGGACIQRLGHRLYFAMPISAEPIRLTTATVSSVPDLELPFDLPNIIGGGYLIEMTTTESHDLATGDTVEIIGAVEPNFNGQHLVVSTPDDTTFIIDASDMLNEVLGERAYVQKLALRNNVVAVYNLALRSYSPPLVGAWESIDLMPAGLNADWLVVGDYGSRRRLWVVDRDLGPCLYEQGDADEVGAELGGLSLPFDLPAELSAANFESAPVNGRLVSRAFKFGPVNRQIKSGEARLTLASGDAGTMTLTVNTPDFTDWVASRDFSSSDGSDIILRKRCGRRGLEAQLEILIGAGRPIVRSLLVDAVAAGKVAE